MTDDEIELEIQAKGLTAPRVTLAAIEAEIASEWYFTAAEAVDQVYQGAVQPECVPAPLCRLTFCVLVLRNGFTVTGESACVSAENFNAELGRKIARQAARQKIWALEGYRLACERAMAAPGPAMAEANLERPAEVRAG